MKAELGAVGLILAVTAMGIGLAFQQETEPAPQPVAKAQPQPPRPRDPLADAAFAARMAEAARQRDAARKAQEAAWKKIQPHLAEADKAAAAAVNRHTGRMEEFFTDRKKRAKPFAEKALSWGSKWEFLKSKLPFTDEDGHKKYLHEQFEETVFSGKEIEEALRSSVDGCVAELVAIDNALLIKIRADLSDDAVGDLKGDVRFPSDAALREEYARAVGKAAKTFSKDLPVWGGQLAVNWVGADVAAVLARSVAVGVISRMGLSGTVLGSGAATGTFTLGAGIVAGFIIDALLDRLLQALGYDPEADIADQVVESLDYCRALVLDGEKMADFARMLRGMKFQDPSGPATKPPPSALKDKTYDDKGGLYDHLCALVKARAKLRNEALKQLILEGGDR